MADRKRKVTLTVDTMWLLGNLLQNESRDAFYFDVADGQIVQIEDWDKQSKKQKLYDQIGTRYIEIPWVAHEAVHNLLDEFIESLDNEAAKEAVSEIRGVGKTLDALEEYRVAREDFQEYTARWWLNEEGIKPVYER
jgi:Uncharacterised protein family (UPF0158)